MIEILVSSSVISYLIACYQRYKGFTTQSDAVNDLSMRASILENINQNFKKNSKIYFGISALILLVLFLTIAL